VLHVTNNAAIPVLLLIGIVIVIAIGGLVEIVPLFYLSNTIEEVSGIRPYTPLELAGRNIYVREGCYLCHSQMIRPLRDEVERYGHYSLAAESMFDRPFQWGSKRIGPDLARVGGKYSDDWHRDHLADPRSVVPSSVMPGYPFLAATELDFAHIDQDLKIQAVLGVPYGADMIANAAADVRTQAATDAPMADEMPGGRGLRRHERHAAVGVGVVRQRLGHDAADARPVSLALRPHRAAGRRLCGPAVLSKRAAGDPGAPPQHGRADPRWA
jgi:cytochrome c oxidase cbb3-type subunit 2